MAPTSAALNSFRWLTATAAALGYQSGREPAAREYIVPGNKSV
jgi:hypothetical protein